MKPGDSISKGFAWLQRLAQSQQKASVPAFGPGDQVRVWCRIVERERVRQVPFEGIVLRRRGAGIAETFTVRRVTHGEGVERVFPVHAPVVEKIDVLRRAKVHRARLYFLRTKIGKTRLAEAGPPGAGAKAAAEAAERIAEAAPSEEAQGAAQQSEAPAA